MTDRDSGAPSAPSHDVSSVPAHFVTSDSGMDVAEIALERLTTRWEVETCEPDTLRDEVVHEIVVKGRLKEYISFWREEIRAPAAIIGTIESGYVLPLRQSLPPTLGQTIIQPVSTPCLYRRVCPSYVIQAV